MYSLLKYSETEFVMRESDKQLLLKLCNNNYCIEVSKGIIVGDQIIITEGPFEGRESIIK